ncbi:MAG: carbohydrate-binding domain-containing protein [Bacteroidaceae bacterium]|nr:carbohydrate-binding domain-containing protein [Bacteroidaceae bacterium]
MKRFFLSVLLVAASQLAAMATEGDIIEIIYNGSTATVNKPETADVTFAVNGAHVIVYSKTTSEEYIYKLSGASTAGSFTLSGSYKLTLELAGLTLINPTGAAINIVCGKRCAVVLDDGTSNMIADGNNGSHDGAIYFKGHPEFEGGGTLMVIGNSKHAIYAKEYLQLKKTTGTIHILGAIKDGIHCGKGDGDFENNFFQMSGGIVNIENVGSDAIDSDDYGRMNIKGGVINATVDALEGTGLKCDSIFNMAGGTINITVNGTDAEAIRANYAAYLHGGEIKVNIAGDGSKGIKCKNKVIGASTGVYDGGTITVDSTNCTFYIHANNLIDATTGEETKIRAISADKDLIHNYGDIEIYSYGSLSNQFHSDTQVIRNGGSLMINYAPWKFYYGDFQHDMTTYVGLKLDDVQVEDLSGYAIGAFIGDECVGVAMDNYLRIYSNTTDAAEVTFKAFDLENERPITVLSVSRDVTFASGSVVGTETAPIILNCRSFLHGDVNGDGAVTIADVTALVNIILGKATDIYNAADINSDSSITIADVTTLVNLILGK